MQYAGRSNAKSAPFENRKGCGTPSRGLSRPPANLRYFEAQQCKSESNEISAVRSPNAKSAPVRNRKGCGTPSRGLGLVIRPK
jgi:hypothetical protein